MKNLEKFKELSYDVVLPAHLLVHPEIEPNAKIFYGFVRNLTKIEGYCFATNKYLSELMDVDIRTIQRWIESLENYGYLEVEIENQQFGSKRKIYISDKFKKFLQHDKSVTPPRQSCHPPHDKNVTHKEDSDKEDISSSSSPSSSDEKEKMRKMMTPIFTFTEEEFEEAWQKYIRLDPAKIPHPKAWFEVVINNNRKSKPEKREIPKATQEQIQAHRKKAEYFERLYPKSSNPLTYINCCDEYVEICLEGKKKQVRYDLNYFEWFEETGWDD